MTPPVQVLNGGWEKQLALCYCDADGTTGKRQLRIELNQHFCGKKIETVVKHVQLL